MNGTEIKQGSLLLAEPFMMDPNFKRTAVLLCEHSPGGSVGFILNRPLAMNVDELIEDFPEFSCEVYWEGRCKPIQSITCTTLAICLKKASRFPMGCIGRRFSKAEVSDRLPVDPARKYPFLSVIQVGAMGNSRTN